MLTEDEAIKKAEDLKIWFKQVWCNVEEEDKPVKVFIEGNFVKIKTDPKWTNHVCDALDSKLNLEKSPMRDIEYLKTITLSKAINRDKETDDYWEDLSRVKIWMWEIEKKKNNPNQKKELVII